MKQLGYYRLLFVALLGVAFYSPLNTLPFYIAVFWLAFELLNAQKLYTGQSYSRFSNLALLSLPIFCSFGPKSLGTVLFGRYCRV